MLESSRLVPLRSPCRPVRAASGPLPLWSRDLPIFSEGELPSTFHFSLTANFHNMILSANVVFASGNVTISREWGTTSLPFNAARPGSVLIIAGEKPGTRGYHFPRIILHTTYQVLYFLSAFVLLKTHDMDPEFCIVETFRIKAPEVHRKVIAQIHNV